jgi:hypothetical protein
MARKRIFISFDYDNDLHYKNLLLAWDANKEFDFELYDGSLTEAINSNNASYIKSRIRPLIEKSTHVLCLVGRYTATNQWIQWEVQTGIANYKRIIAVKIDSNYTSPAFLMNVGASWAHSFSFLAIKSAVESA